MDYNAIYKTVDFIQVKSGIKQPETSTQGNTTQLGYPYKAIDWFLLQLKYVRKRELFFNATT